MRRLGLVIAAAVAAAAPAVAGAARVKFGSTLNQPPTGIDAPYTCDPTGRDSDLGPCTRVALGYFATGAVGDRVSAPVSGVIRRVRVRAALPGAVRLSVARVREVSRDDGQGQARVRSRGVLLRMTGRKPIQTFRVRLRVREGDFLALQGSAFPLLRCQGGNTEQLVFTPSLRPRSAFAASEYYDDCTPLIQATIVT
jgi:hypothetical protein